MCADITTLLSAGEVRGSRVRGLSIYVEKTGTALRGVFAGKRFDPGELIEVAPVIVLPVALVSKTLVAVTYSWDEGSEQARTRAIALGYGSLYNRGKPGNLVYRVDGPGRVIRYFARIVVAAGEELTINYDSMSEACMAAQDRCMERQDAALIGEATVAQAHAREHSV
jgi:uncharacterized protein